MLQPKGYKLDIQLLAKHVRQKRGERSLRDIEAELGIAISVLSRVENAKLPDYHNLGVICYWLGKNPADYFILDAQDENPLTVQLRAAQSMSAETAGAFAEVIRAAYAQVFAQASDDEKA